SRLGGDDFDEAIARLVLKKRGGGALTAHLLDEVRAQKEALTPNTRKFVIDETVVPVDEVFQACMPLIQETIDAMEAVMRDPRRDSDHDVAWTELAGIYVVGGGSGFPAVYRRLREHFGVHRVRPPAGRTARRQPRSLGRAPLSLRPGPARARSGARSGAAARPWTGGRGGLPLRARRHRHREPASPRRRLRAHPAALAAVAV